MFSYSTNQTLHLTHEDYLNGEWGYKNISEEELYDLVSPQIFDLVKRVEIRNLTSPFSDAYEMVIYDINKDIDYGALGIQFNRKDYYASLKTYCLSLKYSDFWDILGLGLIPLLFKDTFFSKWS